MAFLHTNQARQQCFPESMSPFFNHNNLIKLILHSSGISYVTFDVFGQHVA